MDRTALIVEDDRSTQRALELLLRDWGFKTACCPSVQASIAELEREVPDYVLLDLMLTDGSGLSVQEFIQDREMQTRIIVMSAAVDDVLERSRRLNPMLVMRKPIEFDLLRATMRRITP